MRRHLCSILAAVAVLATSCMSGTQQYALHSQRIAAEKEIAMRPAFRAASASDVEVYDQHAGIGAVPDQLQAWLDAGIKAGWIGVSAFGIYKLSDKIGGSSHKTTNNYYDNGTEVAP